MTTCAHMSRAVIENYISKILSHNLDISTAEISKLLYVRFADIYPATITWVFYTAWSFNPVSGPHVAYSGESYYMTYTGSGSSGVTKYDGWSVYWVGHPVPYSNPIKWISVNHDAIVKNAQAMVHQPYYFRSAQALGKSLNPSFFSMREPVAIMIFTYPPTYATAGRTAYVPGDYTSFYIRRITGFPWPGPTWYNVLIDVIIFWQKHNHRSSGVIRFICRNTVINNFIFCNSTTQQYCKSLMYTLYTQK